MNSIKSVDKGCKAIQREQRDGLLMGVCDYPLQKTFYWQQAICFDHYPTLRLI